MLAKFPIAAVLPCVDMARARQFYGETLELPEMSLPIPEDAGVMEQTAAMFQCGSGTMFLVYERETPTKADHTAAGWLVDDLESIADKLISRGIVFEVYPEMPGIEWDDRGVAFSNDGGRGAWFKDPDGNILSLTESRS